MKYLVKLLVTAIFIFHIASEFTYGQVLYGSLTGQVEDSTNASVPSVAIKATNKSTGQEYETTSDAAGRFTITNVLAGTYTVRTQANGFRTLEQRDVLVTINTVRRLDLKLEVGQVSQQVTVESSAVVMQTDKADTHTEISSKPISTLPLNQFRNYQALINLVPGATPAQFQNSATDSPQRSLATNVNGTNKNNNTTRVDGATNVFIWLPHHNLYVASSEVVETVNVSTSSFDAEQGMAGGAAVTVVTKSGTNALHGSAFEFHDDQHLKARNYFLQKGKANPLGISNIFGGTIGGPIIKNKLFYFASFEGTHQRTGGTGIYSTPTAAMRAGDFSASGTNIYNPYTGNSNGEGRQMFAGNKVDPALISPISQKVLALVPLPNLPGDQNNYTATGVQKYDRNQGDIKINWNRNDKNIIWGKLGIMDAQVGAPFVFGSIGGPAVVGDAANGSTRVYIGTVGTTYTFSPQLFFDGTLGYARMDQIVAGSDYGKNYGIDVFGIPGTNGPDIRQSGLPYFTISGLTDLGQTASWTPLFRNDRSWTSSDNVTWIHGPHQFRFGFDLVHFSLNHWQPEQGYGPRGGFSFNGGATALNATGASAPNVYNAYAAFLLGLPDSRNKSLQYIPLSGREWQFGWYGQDRWQLTKKLTLNAGLRYELYPLMTREKSGIERLDFTNNTLYMGGRGNVPTNAGISVNKLLFAPRLGLAYRATDNTVLRAGYGMTYDPLPFSRPLRGWYPYTISQTFPSDTSYGYTNIAANALAQGIAPIVGPDISTGITSIPSGVEERSPGTHIRRGYIQSWNATVEQRFPGNLITSIGYVGTRTTHQFSDRDINYSLPGGGQAGRVLYDTFGNSTIHVWDGWLSSNYHSLQVALNRQFTNGLFLKGAYTWSKAINMTDEDGWAGLQFYLPSMLNANRAPAGFDRRHVFQIAAIYELPFGKGQKWATNDVPAAILGGWQANTVFYAYTGNPFTINAPGTSLNAPGAGDQVADRLKTVSYPKQVKKWFDTTAFTPVTAVRYGNSGRNSVYGPGVIGDDLSLFRTFPLMEKYRLEFRAEAFNVTNTPRFSNPNNNVTDQTFGVISGTATGSDRQFRFGLKLAF